jgi:hypothetical protein
MIHLAHKQTHSKKPSDSTNAMGKTIAFQKGLFHGRTLPFQTLLAAFPVLHYVLCLLAPSSFDTVTGYWVMNPWFESRRGKEIYTFSETSRPALGLTHPPIQRATRALHPELQWRECEFNRSPPLSVKVKNEWRYTSTLPTGLHGVQYGQLYLYLWQVVKGKAIPIQAWTGPEGSSRLRLSDFKTVGTWKVVRLSDVRTGRLYQPGNIPGTHSC